MEALESQHLQPVGMGVTRHKFSGSLIYSLEHLAAHEAAMIQEKRQQAQLGITQTPAQEKVVLQTKIQVLPSELARGVCLSASVTAIRTA